MEPTLRMNLVAASSFVDGENWTGGFYELAICMGGRDDARLDAAARCVWGDVRLVGPYADRHREPGKQKRLEDAVGTSLHLGHLRGLAALPSGAHVVCGMLNIREEGEGGSDWLDFYLPLGALARADQRVGAFPFGAAGTESLLWRAPIDAWLVSVAERVFAAAPFAYALIGFEGSGETPPLEDTAERYVGLVAPRGGRLHYLPANR
jgi:hypothetical protein